MAQTILPQQHKPPQDPLREALKRAFIGRQIPPTDNAIHLGQYEALPLAPDLPESKPLSFTEVFKAALLRGLRRAR